MRTNPLANRSDDRSSPTDPQECCDWANERLIARDPLDARRWVVTGIPAKPIALTIPDTRYMPVIRAA